MGQIKKRNGKRIEQKKESEFLATDPEVPGSIPGACQIF
jgi:hypothetical protein